MLRLVAGLIGFVSCLTFVAAQTRVPLQDQAGQVSSSKLSIAEFSAIVADAEDSWDVSRALLVFPRLERAVGVVNVQLNGRNSQQTVVATNKASRKKYVVMERTVGAVEPLASVVVVTFDESQNVYRRWQLNSDGQLTMLIGISEPNATANWASGKLIKTTISWHEQSPASGQQSSFGTEVLESQSSQQSGSQSWNFVSMIGNSVASRLSMKIEFRQSFENWAAKSTEQKQKPAVMMSRQPDAGAVLNGPESDAPLWQGGESRPDAREYRFEDLNFVLKSPGTMFRKLQPRADVANARLVLARYVPASSIILFGEKLQPGLSFTTQVLARACRRDVVLDFPQAKISEFDDVTYGGVQFTRFVALFDEKGGPVARCYSSAVHRGFAYQFSNLVKGRNEAYAKVEADRILAGFRLIDNSLPEQPLVEEFRLPAMGLADSFASNGGVAWSDSELKANCRGAVRGVSFPDGDGIMIVPFDPSGLEVDEGVVANVLLNVVRVRYPDEVRAAKPHQQGSAIGRQMSSVWDAGTSEEKTVQIRLLKNGEIWVAMAAYGLGSGTQIQDRLQEKLDLVSLTPPPPLAKRRQMSAQVTGGAFLHNQIGMGLYEKQMFQEAHEFFALASDRDPFEKDFLLNAVLALRRTGNLTESLEFLKKRAVFVLAHNDLRAAEAALLSLVDRPEDALLTYKDLFSHGFRDQGHLLIYLRLLTDAEQYDEAVSAIEDVLADESSPSLELRRWYQEVLFAAGQLDRSIALAKQLCAEFPDVTELSEDYVKLLIDAEREEPALAEIARLKNKGARSAVLEFYAGLAYLQSKRYAAAKSAFEQSLEYSPGDTAVLEFLNHTSALLGEGDNSSIKTPLELVAIPDAVQRQLDALSVNKTVPGYNAQTITATTGLYFRPDEQRRRTEYRTIKVLTQAGVDSYKTIRCYFDPTFEDAFVNQLEVLDEANRVVAVGQVSDYYVSSVREADMATTQSVLCAPVPGLKPGYTLRYAYTIQDRSTSANVPFEKNLFATVAPSGPRAYFISGDVSRFIGFQEHGDFRAGRDRNAMWWVLPTPPRLTLESAIPSLEEFVPNIWLGNVQESWQQMGTEYLSRLNDCMVPSSAARDKALELVNNARNDSEKTIAILEWVRSTLVYQGIEFGSRAQIPNSAERIIRNRYGDCKDHSLLAWQMLRAANVPCHLAILHTHAKLRKSLPSMSQFNHMIVYLPQFEGGRFVDLTSKNQDIRLTASAAMANTEALVLAPGAVHFRMIQDDPRSQSRLVSARTVRLDQSRQNFQVTETLTAFGGAASSFRAFFRNTNTADQKPAIHKMLAKDSRFRLESLEVMQLDSFSKPLKIQLSYQVNRALQNTGTSYSGTLPAVWEEYFFERSNTAERKNPFELSSPLVFESNVRLELPPGLALDKSSLTMANRRTRWMTFAANRGFYNGALNYSTRLVQQKGVFPRTDYRLFLETIDAALDTARGRLKLTTVSARTRR